MFIDSNLEEDTGNVNVEQNDGDEVRPPLPVIREALYDDAMLYGYVPLFSAYLHLFKSSLCLQFQLEK